MLPKITIITPTLNQCEFIERTILSVLNQNYPKLEYIIFDGGSNDGTIEILRKYSDQITWYSEPDRGQSHALNKGLSIASGEIIGFINSDDEYEPDTFQKVGRFFFNNPEAMWVTGKCRIIDPHENEILSVVTLYKQFLLRFDSLYLLGIVNYIPQPATFWRREIIQEIGFFDESLRYVMDYDYWLRIRSRYPLYKLRDHLARFRFYPSSKTWQSALKNESEEEYVIKKYVKSRFILTLHRLHRITINRIYEAINRSKREK